MAKYSAGCFTVKKLQAIVRRCKSKPINCAPCGKCYAVPILWDAVFGNSTIRVKSGCYDSFSNSVAPSFRWQRDAERRHSLQGKRIRWCSEWRYACCPQMWRDIAAVVPVVMHRPCLPPKMAAPTLDEPVSLTAAQKLIWQRMVEATIRSIRMLLDLSEEPLRQKMSCQNLCGRHCFWTAWTSSVYETSRVELECYGRWRDGCCWQQRRLKTQNCIPWPSGVDFAYETLSTRLAARALLLPPPSWRSVHGVFIVRVTLGYAPTFKEQPVYIAPKTCGLLKSIER